MSWKHLFLSIVFFSLLVPMLSLSGSAAYAAEEPPAWARRNGNAAPAWAPEHNWKEKIGWKEKQAKEGSYYQEIGRALPASNTGKKQVGDSPQKPR